MGRVSKVCWNYERLMQRSFDVILADIINSSDATNGKQRRLENLAFSRER
jgi:hypothetical protein